jgi:ribosomal protein S18 acetylase RimI-like enzyme
MLEIKRLIPAEWIVLRSIRLSALQESPQAFLSTHERENAYGEDRWRAEFVRGSWNIGMLEANPISLLGVTRDPSISAYECYLEYLWVSPRYRRCGAGFRMLTTVLKRLQDCGVRTAFLWVLDGNEAATSLYERVGFVRTNHRQPLTARPGRSEERLMLTLG